MSSFAAKEFLALGLETVGYDRWESYKEDANIKRFRQHFGVDPQTCEEVWSDVKRSMPGAKPKHLLLGLRWLWKYDTEADLSPMFDMSEKTVRKWTKQLVSEIMKLLPEKMDSPEDDTDFIYIGTIDGVHFPTWEPRPWSKANSSWKLGGNAGLAYGFGLRLHEPKLFWIHGPDPAGEGNDLTIFREGLRDRIPPGKRVIGDDGYLGEADLISTRNVDFDPREVAYFKERAMSRQEAFHTRLKNFHCLSTDFRHGKEQHKNAVEAICALLMHEYANGTSSLFDPFP